MSSKKIKGDKGSLRSDRMVTVDTWMPVVRWSYLFRWKGIKFYWPVLKWVKISRDY